MGYKPPLKIKIEKTDFKTVAKHSGVTGLTTKKFRDSAFNALRKAGYGSTDATGIISGSKKMAPGSLKRVFDKLYKDKVIKKGPSVVTNYLKEEKAKKERVIRLHLRERADQIFAEKKAEGAAKKQSQQKTAPAKSGQSAPLMSSGGFGPAAPSSTTPPASQSSLPDWKQSDQNWEQPGPKSTMPNQPNPKDQPSANEVQKAPVLPKENEEALEDMVID